MVITPDFLADDTDPLWPYTDAVLHRPCFLVWPERKILIARYNLMARRLVADDGSYPQMTGEGEMVRRLGGPGARRGPVA